MSVANRYGHFDSDYLLNSSNEVLHVGRNASKSVSVVGFLEERDLYCNLGFNTGSDQSLRSAIVLDVCKSNSKNVIAVAYSCTSGLRMKPAPSDGTYLVRGLKNELYRDPAVDVHISFVCKCSTTRVT